MITLSFLLILSSMIFAQDTVVWKPITDDETYYSQSFDEPQVYYSEEEYNKAWDEYYAALEEAQNRAYAPATTTTASTTTTTTTTAAPTTTTTTTETPTTTTTKATYYGYYPPANPTTTTTAATTTTTPTTTTTTTTTTTAAPTTTATLSPLLNPLNFLTTFGGFVAGVVVTASIQAYILVQDGFEFVESSIFYLRKKRELGYVHYYEIFFTDLPPFLHPDIKITGHMHKKDFYDILKNS